MTKKEREAAIEKGLRSVPLRPQDESRFRRPSKSLASAGRSVFIKEGPQEVLPTDSEQQVLTKAISSKDYPHLAGLFAVLRRCGFSYRAKLCAFRRAWKATKNPPRLENIFFGKRLKTYTQ